jgi:hypothetical protein
MRRAAGIGLAERFYAHCLFPMTGRSRHPFRMLESTLGTGTLPPQPGVYVPRRLSHASGPVTGDTLGRPVGKPVGLPLSRGW